MLLSGIHKPDEVLDLSQSIFPRKCLQKLFVLIPPLPQFSITTRTPGGRSRPRWNKTNYIAGRSSNKSVLKRERRAAPGQEQLLHPEIPRPGRAGEPAETRVPGEPCCPRPTCGVLWAITAPKFCSSAQRSAPHCAKVMRFLSVPGKHIALQGGRRNQEQNATAFQGSPDPKHPVRG